MSNKPTYNSDAVQQAIDASNRNAKRIRGKEAKAIHALLKGWRS